MIIKGELRNCSSFYKLYKYLKRLYTIIYSNKLIVRGYNESSNTSSKGSKCNNR